MSATVPEMPLQLRPLALGEVLDVAAKIVKRNFGTLSRVVLVVVLPVQILSTIIQISAAPAGWTIQGIPPRYAPPPDQFFITASDRNAELSGFLIALVLAWLAGTLAAGACYRAIASAYLGEETSWGASLRYAARRLHSLVWIVVISTVVTLVGLVACIIPGIYLYGGFAVAVPVLLSENRKGFKALGRSKSLVDGFWWRTIGVVILGAVLTGIVSGVLDGLLIGLLSIGSNTSSALFFAGNTIAGTLSRVVTTPFTAAFVTVLYFDLRVRKEAFDLQLLAQRLGVDPPEGWSPTPGRGFPTYGGSQPPFWPPPPGWTPTPGEGPAAPLWPPPAPPSDEPPFWPPPPGWTPGERS